MAAGLAGILFLPRQGYAMVGKQREREKERERERRMKNVGTTSEEIAGSFPVRLKEGALCIQTNSLIRECVLLGTFKNYFVLFTISILNYNVFLKPD